MHLAADETPFRTVSPAVNASGAYQPVSFWQETIAVAPGNPLAGDTACDVAIIGGGFTGLSTAYELKRAAPDLDVVLLERSVIGHGASGRNGGFAMPLIGWDLTDAVRKLGGDGAKRAYQLMYDAVAHTKRMITENHIDCDLESTGYLLISTTTRRDGHIRHEVELGRRLGFDHQLLEKPELEEHIHSDSFRLGAYDPHPLIINPFKLARGLKGLVEKTGVRVYEQSPLLELSEGNPVRIRTSQAEVRARAVLLAVNGYGAGLGFLPQRIIPVHTYIVLTESLTAAQLDSIGWRKRRTSLETCRNFIHYFRLTADNRIAFGGEDAKLFWGGGYRDVDPPTFEKLESRFREFFPSLSQVKFTHRWGGVLGVTLDMFPTFGVDTNRGNIFHAAGYSGHGVSLSNYAGRILAPKILANLGKSTPDSGPLPFFFGRLPTRLPPEPLRYVGLQVYRRCLQALDSWVER
jgi:glycine/D-amino acid oxidase-like deaminating enzyme